MATKPVKKPLSPALEQTARLVVAFDLFNQELFDGALPPVWLQLRNKPGSYGYFQPNKWASADGSLIDVISLDSRTASERPLKELLSTLAHEMCHQYVCRVINDGKATGGHGGDWRREMLRIGLPPIQIGATWRSATHSIASDGLFAEVFAKHEAQLKALPWQECVKQANRGRGLDRVRFQCPTCGSNAWARAAALLMCGNCSTPERLVEMLPEFRPEGGGGKGSGQRANAKREHYPEPTGVPSLPVWTDELGRELRTRTGLDHPPTSREEALVVMLFGLAHRAPELHKQLDTAISSGDDAALAAALKRVYRHRAQELHPDSGGTKVAFQVLGAALGILQSKTKRK